MTKTRFNEIIRLNKIATYICYHTNNFVGIEKESVTLKVATKVNNRIHEIESTVEDIHDVWDALEIGEQLGWGYVRR